MVIALVWLFGRYFGGRTRTPPESDRPYAPFTKDFDVTCEGRDIREILHDRGIDGLPPRNTVTATIEDRLAIAQEAYASCAAGLAKERQIAGIPSDTAIIILVDQSGSMVNRMPNLAGQLRAVVEGLLQARIPTALLGFTTCGWRGGRSRDQWIRAGRPRYPGRLCDLLHITYKAFDEPLDEEDWLAILRPDALFENLDGEALEWSRSLLEARPEMNLLLIVVSDGAPVDDSSLSENGASFLERHLLATIDNITRHEAIKLGAIGIDHGVDRYYPASERVDDARSFPAAFITLAGKLLGGGDRCSDVPEDA